MTEPDQVRIRMLEIGICGTDKEICAFEYGTPPEGSDYLVIGHESLGEVMEVGPEVSRVKVGDRVAQATRTFASPATIAMRPSGILASFTSAGLVHCARSSRATLHLKRLQVCCSAKLVALRM